MPQEEMSLAKYCKKWATTELLTVASPTNSTLEMPPIHTSSHSNPNRLRVLLEIEEHFHPSLATLTTCRERHLGTSPLAPLNKGLMGPGRCMWEPTIRD